MASNETIYSHWSALYLIDLKCGAYKWSMEEAEGKVQQKVEKHDMGEDKGTERVLRPGERHRRVGGWEGWEAEEQRSE